MAPAQKKWMNSLYSTRVRAALLVAGAGSRRVMDALRVNPDIYKT